MKRSRGFGVPDDINILSYLIKLRLYWRSFLLAFVVGLCGGYYYLLKNIPLPSSQAVLEIGFPDVSAGKYPNGGRFDKNDLISVNIVRKAVEAIPELKQNPRWSPESLSGMLSLTEVYPMEIQVAFDALSSKNKLAPQDVVANYEKINSYFPSKFAISFRPSPLMPVALQKKFMEELIKQYSAFVLDSRIPLALRYGGKGIVTTETDNVAAYGYLAAALDEIDEQIAANAKKMSLNAIGSNPAVAVNSDAKQKNFSSGGDDEFMRLSQAANSTTLQKFKTDMAAIEHLIFNEKTVPNPDEYRNKLLSDISWITTEIEIKKRQAEYKISLARIPNESAPKATANASDNSPQGADKTIMGILLSYNAQYYSLINETNVIFDDISRMEGKLIKLKERLKVFDAIGPVIPGATYEARSKILGEHLKLAQGHLLAYANELADSTKAAYSGYRPPVANSTVVGVVAGISLTNAYLAGLAAVLLLMVFRVLKMMIDDAQAQRQAAFPAPQEIGGVSRTNIKK